MQIKKFRQMYLAELQELRSMEMQLGVALRHLAEAATSPRLIETLMRHAGEAIAHKERLDHLLRRHETVPEHVDRSMQALILEAQRMALLLSTNALRDAGTIASAQRLEHYEIAAYGTTAALAEELGLREDQKLLRQSLDEERLAEAELARLAREEINPPAAAADKASEAAEEEKAEVEGKEMPMEPVAVGSPALPGLLTLPKPGYGIILFAHGTDGSRLSPRNRHVAAELHKAGFGTLLFDLLTEEEAFRRANVFDIPLLASRLLMATEWLDERDDLRCAPFGYFGASTGAAAALLAAGEAKHGPSAIGSRGGRPDLAAHALERVAAPVLLIVGGADREVLMLNRRTFAELPGEKEIAVLPGSGHLFEERSALDQVVALALRWFERYLHQPHIPESRLDGDRLAPSAAE